MPLPSVPFSQTTSFFLGSPVARAPFSWGRFLGSWVGMALTPVLPMLKWIFAPYFDLEKLTQGFSAATLAEYQAHLNALSAGTLLGLILPELLLCLGVCLLFSWAFSWVGGLIEGRLGLFRAS